MMMTSTLLPTVHRLLGGWQFSTHLRRAAILLLQSYPDQAILKSRCIAVYHQEDPTVPPPTLAHKAILELEKLEKKDEEVVYWDWSEEDPVSPPIAFKRQLLVSPRMRIAALRGVGLIGVHPQPFPPANKRQRIPPGTPSSAARWITVWSGRCPVWRSCMSGRAEGQPGAAVFGRGGPGGSRVCRGWRRSHSRG